MRENSLKYHASHCKLTPHSLIGQGRASYGASQFSKLPGEVPEWPNGLASKAGVLARGPWVQIPPSPPNQNLLDPTLFLSCLAAGYTLSEIAHLLFAFSPKTRRNSTIANVSRLQ